MQIYATYSHQVHNIVHCDSNYQLTQKLRLRVKLDMVTLKIQTRCVTLHDQTG